MAKKVEFKIAVTHKGNKEVIDLTERYATEIIKKARDFFAAAKGDSIQLKLDAASNLTLAKTALAQAANVRGANPQRAHTLTQQATDYAILGFAYKEAVNYGPKKSKGKRESVKRDTSPESTLKRAFLQAGYTDGQAAKLAKEHAAKGSELKAARERTEKKQEKAKRLAALVEKGYTPDKAQEIAKLEAQLASLKVK